MTNLTPGAGSRFMTRSGSRKAMRITNALSTLLSSLTSAFGSSWSRGPQQSSISRRTSSAPPSSDRHSFIVSVGIKMYTNFNSTVLIVQRRYVKRLPLLPWYYQIHSPHIKAGCPKTYYSSRKTALGRDGAATAARGIGRKLTVGSPRHRFPWWHIASPGLGEPPLLGRPGFLAQ